MAYMYRHIRLDKNEPFYVGIGSDETYKRAYSEGERSDFWRFITAKTSYRVDILQDNISWKEACLKEIEFIALYGRADLKKGPLCNMTDGGEGAYGRIPSQSFRKKMSERMSGVNHPMYNKTHSKEARRKISEAGKRPMLDHVRVILKKRNGTGPFHPNRLAQLKKGPMTQAKSVINTITVEVFGCIKDAAASAGFLHSTLSRKLSGKRKNNTQFKYL